MVSWVVAAFLAGTARERSQPREREAVTIAICADLDSNNVRRNLAHSEQLANSIQQRRSLSDKEASMSVHAWEEILKQIEQETDLAKIAELARKLTDAMVSEEKEKVKHRLSIPPDKHAS